MAIAEMNVVEVAQGATGALIQEVPPFGICKVLVPIFSTAVDLDILNTNVILHELANPN